MAGRIQGLSIGLGMESAEVSRSMSEIRREMRGLNSEAKVTNNNMRYGKRDTQSYTKAIDSLSSTTEKQRKNVEELGKRYAQTVEEQGASSKAAQSLGIEYNKQADNLNRLEHQLSQTEAEFAKFQEEQRIAQSNWTKTGKAIESHGKQLQSVGGGMRKVGGIFTKMSAAVVGAATGVVGGLFAMTDQATQAGDEIAKGATKMGISTDAYQELSFWASQNSIDHSTFTRALERMNQRVGLAADGNEKYASAFESLGVSIYDAGGNMRDTEDVMNDTITALSGIEDESLRSAKASEIFGTRLARQLMPALEEGSTSMDEAKEIAHELGIVMGEDQLRAAEQFQTAKDQITTAMSAIGMQIGLDLMPHFQGLLDWVLDNMPSIRETITGAFESVIESVKGVVGWWNQLSETSQKLIGVGTGLALAFGPILTVSGMLVGSIGNLLVPMGKLLQLIAAKGGLTASLGLLGGKIGAFITAAAPWAAAIAGVGLAAYGLVSHFREGAIPAVDDFGNEVSETTTQAVLDFMNLSTSAEAELNYLFESGTIITEEGTAQLTNYFSQMLETIRTEMSEKFNQNRQILSEFFNETEVMSEANEQRILENMDQSNAEQEQKLAEHETRYKEIMQTAADEQRALTEAEKNELDRINEEMRTNAVQTLSQSEQEQTIIMERLEQNSGAINARMASETVQRAIEARDGAVSEAEEKYEDVISAVAYERDVTGSISAEEADKIIEEAEKQRRESINEAEERHEGVVSAAREQAGEHVDAVDWETGEILSKWDQFKGDVSQVWSDVSGNAKDTWDELLNFFGWASDSALSIWDSFKDGMDEVWTQVSDNAKDTWNELLGFIEWAINGITGGINWILDALGSDFEIGEVSMTSHAKGTDSHPGGLALVNDAPGSNYQEMFQTPDGKTGIFPEQRNMVVPLPKGSAVLPGKETSEIMKGSGIPKYAGGIGNFISGAWDSAKDFAGNALDTAKDTVGNIWGWISDGASAVLDNALDFLGFSMPDIDENVALGSLASGAFTTVKDAAVDFLQGKINDLFTFSGVNFPGLTMTSGFGPRSSPGGIGSTNHMGVDFAGPVGTPIPAQAGGQVTMSGWYGGLGNMVEVTQGNTKYRYGHNSENLVSVGDSVSPGQKIALVGSTGNSTGPHVHFEIIHNGSHVDPMNFGGDIAVGGTGVNQWRGVATQALRMTNQFSPGNLSSLLYQMQTESGGNPRAQNNWDINARMGTPSKGLMQVIDPTFQAYKMPGYGNIWNPLDNILASIRYAVSRYGSLGAAYRGVGYATGGLVEEDGLYRLAEEGYPEFVIPTDPKRRTDAMKLLALAGKRIQGNNQQNKRPNQLSNANHSVPVENGGDTYHIHITANGYLPQSVIRNMADRIEQEIKKKNDRKRASKGERVSFS